ncbi:MAG: glycosyl hydrolase family 8 [Methanophagales archaeon]|nr:glycosyl hydrolase family 8 [Methanophagales archaeon]
MENKLIFILVAALIFLYVFTPIAIAEMAELPDLIVNGRTIVLTSGEYFYNIVQITNGGVISIQGNVTIHANTISIDSTSSIAGNGVGDLGLGNGENGHGGCDFSDGGGGGGGAYGGNGGDGGYGGWASPGKGGKPYGSLNGTDSYEGSKGGKGGKEDCYGGAGGLGGGAISLFCTEINIEGNISVNGADGRPAGYDDGGGGGGSGGGILISASSISLGSDFLFSAKGGNGGYGGSTDGGRWHGGGGGGGSGGRVKILYSDSTTFNETEYSPLDCNELLKAISGNVNLSGGAGGLKGGYKAENGKSGDNGTINGIDITTILNDAWGHYKKYKIASDGRPLCDDDSKDIDGDGTYTENVTVSEGSSYCMLRAVWMNEQETFDKVWNWTKNNLQRCNIKEVYYWNEHRWAPIDELPTKYREDQLFAWRWYEDVNNTGKDGVIYYEYEGEGKLWRDGFDAATDADEDMVLALIFADSLVKTGKWNQTFDYANEAKLILKDIWDKEGNTDVVICSGMERGGGREFVLVNSCDGLIAVSGGSGTMNEMLVAYQLNIPIVVIKGTGGWADKMAGKYFDSRQRMKAVPAKIPREAVQKIINLIK